MKTRKMYIAKPYRIVGIEKFTEEIRLIRVKYKNNPLPGQFIEVSIPGIGECPLASCSYSKESIDILVKKVGNVTSAIFKLKRNDEVFIRGPYGNGWPIKELKGKNLIIVGGGTGIAPVTSVIEYVEKNRENFKRVLIYFAFRNYDSVLLKKRIKRWEKEFDLKIVLNEKIEKKEEIRCVNGFVQDILFNDKPELENSVGLLCGPEGMMKAVTDKLVNMGLKESDILWAVERRMECGFGSCGRCQIQDLYVCKDGPIFRYNVLKPRLENEDYSNSQQL